MTVKPRLSRFSTLRLKRVVCRDVPVFRPFSLTDVNCGYCSQSWRCETVVAWPSEDVRREHARGTGSDGRILRRTQRQIGIGQIVEVVGLELFQAEHPDVRRLGHDLPRQLLLHADLPLLVVGRQAVLIDERELSPTCASRPTRAAEQPSAGRSGRDWRAW